MYVPENFEKKKKNLHNPFSKLSTMSKEDQTQYAEHDTDSKDSSCLLQGVLHPVNLGDFLQQ